MDEELNRTPFIIEFLHKFAVCFTTVLLVFSFLTMLIVRYYPEAQNESALFAPGTGFSFSTIIQITGFSVAIAIFNILLFSKRSPVKMRYPYRMPCFILLTLLAGSAFSAIFSWFPVNDPEAWSGFATGFSITACLAYLSTRKKEKKYNRLLANYKARNSGTGK